MIYSSTHPGMRLSETKLNSLALTTNELKGYFSREDIFGLLGMGLTAGLRIYNTARSDQGIIAVAVQADGFEIAVDFSCMQSHGSASSNHLNGADMIQLRSTATQHVNTALDTTTFDSPSRFSSFFSESMLRHLLADNGFSGVCFYEVAIISFPANIFPPHMQAQKDQRMTHLGVATNLNSGNIIGFSAALASANVLSDQPCKGHCLGFDNTGKAQLMDAPVGSPATPNTDNPYLIKW